MGNQGKDTFDDVFDSPLVSQSLNGELGDAIVHYDTLRFLDQAGLPGRGSVVRRCRRGAAQFFEPATDKAETVPVFLLPVRRQTGMIRVLPTVAMPRTCSSHTRDRSTGDVICSPGKMPVEQQISDKTYSPSDISQVSPNNPLPILTGHSVLMLILRILHVLPLLPSGA